MINSRDESAVVLNAHLVLEDFLNLWCSTLTGTDDLFAGGFVNFKTKLNISRNLGLELDLCKALDKFNDIRNKYSHQRKYCADSQVVESLASRINAAVPDLKITPCKEYVLETSGVDQSGARHETRYTWDDSTNNTKFVIALFVLVFKVTHWMQVSFDSRGIDYTLITSLPTHSQDGF